MEEKLTQRYENITVTPKEDSEVEISGAFPVDAVAHYRKKTLRTLGKDVEVPGFRKGHVPERMIVEKLGEQTILEKAAESAFAENYPLVVAEHGLKVIGQPQVLITKLAPGNPIEWKITTAVVPEVILPDYRALARKALDGVADESAEATDEEVDKVILQLRENKWRIDHPDSGRSTQTTSDTPAAHLATIGTSPTKQPDESKLPDLTLEFVKTLGDFSSLDDFRAKIKANIAADKKRKQHEKRRVAIGENLIAETKVALPRILVEGELEKMLAQFKYDVAALGTPFAEYLTKIKKTEDDLRREWMEDAKKRATLQLALNEIATRENITPDDEDVKKQTAHILEHHKRARRSSGEGGDAKEENIRIYAATILQNEKVFQFLEGKE